MSRVRCALFGAVVGLYLAIVVAVLVSTWLVHLDWQVMFFRPYKQWPELHAFLDYFVVLGQRAPTAVLVGAWLAWRSWRQRTLRPLLVLATALLALNASVGAVKIGLGRLGPHYATTIGSTELWDGGDIFPSGHTANAVVTWGILAYLATTPVARRALSVVAAFFALSVGATTVYLGTHWVSDVLLGWAAGLLVLLGLPWFEPAIARAEALILAARERLLTSGGRELTPSAAPSPVVAPRALPAEEGVAHSESQQGQPNEGAVAGAHALTVSGGRSAAGTATGSLHHSHSASRQHPLRNGRAPVGPRLD